MAAVVTATTLPSAERSASSEGRTTLKKPPASSVSWRARSAGSTLLRCTIGTCGPAACTSVCNPPWCAVTAETSSLQAWGSAVSSWCELTRTPNDAASPPTRPAAASCPR